MPLKNLARFELYNGRLQGSPHGPYCRVADVQALLDKGAPSTGVRYPTPEEHRALDQLDAMRATLQAVGANVCALPGVDAAAATRALSGAQKHLVQLATLVQAAARR